MICGAAPRCKVRFDDATPDHRFIISFEYVDATRDVVTLELVGYKIEVDHIGPHPELRHAKWYLTFDSDDGLDVQLKRNGRPIAVTEAAKQILKPVLYAEG